MRSKEKRKSQRSEWMKAKFEKRKQSSIRMIYLMFLGAVSVLYGLLGFHGLSVAFMLLLFFELIQDLEVRVE